MTADTIGGVWQYALELARGLISRGDQVALATMGAQLTLQQRRELDGIRGLALYPSTFKLAWMDSPWADVERSNDWIRSVAAQVRPDIVHLNDYSHGALDWKVPAVVTGHSCVLSWWQAVHGADAPPEWNRYRDSVRQGLQGADLVVSPTRAMLAQLQRLYGPLEATRVISNGRTPVRRMPAWRGTPRARAPMILAAGRLWDEAKNIGALAAVAPRLPWPVCVAGDQRHPDGGEVSLDNVRLLGRLGSDQLASWYSRAAIYALPARYEPFGLSALEAAQGGCALVLGDIPSLREVWGDAALFVPPDDPEALAATLLELIAQPELCMRYARRARRRATRYGPRAMVDQYRRAYAELSPPRASAPRSAASRGTAIGVSP